MHVQQLMYPSEAIYKVHKSIQHNFDVAQVDKVSDVRTMFEYIGTFQQASRQFSPASVDYAADYRQRIFVSTPRSFPPVKYDQPLQPTPFGDD